MRSYARPFALAAAGASLLILSGCTKKSPAIGTWTAGTPLGNATVTLAEGGAGTMSAPPLMNSTQVTWQEKDKHVQLQMGNKPAAETTPAGINVGANLEGTISDDGKTMTVPVAGRSLTMTKQEAAK